MLRIVMLCVILFPAPGTAAERLTYILMGQSNMSGRAPLADAPPVEHHERIFIFGNDDRWRPFDNFVDSPIGQKRSVSLDAVAGFGPAPAFASRLAELIPGVEIGLVPCAKGQSVIDDWEHDHSLNALFGSCLLSVDLARGKGRLAGVLWYQGETDALIHGPEYGQVWKQKFLTLMTIFKRDVGAADIPVVVAQLGSDPGRQGWEAIKAAQASLADVPGYSVVKTDDLSTQPDKLHLTATSYVTVGQRFAEAMAAIELKEERDR